ncbi:MAG: hypothetical protein KA155_04450 [Alphaproteobacteria bacterium]|jgi:hypothetical protein|nr:hypothetical protein [Alphaproteobacteria bacterium]
MVEFADDSNNMDWAAILRAMSPAFDGIRPDPSWATRDAVHQTTKKTLQTLDRDIETLEGEAKFIFSLSAGAEGLTQQSVAMLLRWHIAERAPSLSALAIFVAKYLGTNMPPEIARAVLAASVLGEVENNLPYHNNLHYKKVLFQTARLIAMHNNIYEGTDQTFNCKKIGMLMIAACIHDLGHDGRGNTIKGVFEPGRLERRAFKLAFPYLEACGLDYADLEKLRVMLLCTDVAPLGDPANPVNQMKSAYRYHFLGQKRKTGPLNLDEDLEPLQRDADLTMMCAILHEADIGTSAGLDYNVTTYETGLYKREMGEEQAFPKDIVDFLNDICQRQMLTDAGQRLFAANMARIFALAEREIADGNHAFPQPEYSDFLLLHSGGADGPGKTIN